LSWSTIEQRVDQVAAVNPDAALLLERPQHHRAAHQLLSCAPSVRRPVHRAGTPSMIEYGSTSRVTTAPAPITLPRPTRTPSSTVAPAPSQQSSSMTTPATRRRLCGKRQVGAAPHDVAAPADVALGGDHRVGADLDPRERIHDAIGTDVRTRPDAYGPVLARDDATAADQRVVTDAKLAGRATAGVELAAFVDGDPIADPHLARVPEANVALPDRAPAEASEETAAPEELPERQSQRARQYGAPRHHELVMQQSQPRPGSKHEVLVGRHRVVIAVVHWRPIIQHAT
jgi:hypothetical protein